MAAVGVVSVAGALAADGRNALAPAGVARPWQATAAYTVLLPEAPTSQDEYAARWLGEALEKMTGVRLPVVREPSPGSEHGELGDHHGRAGDMKRRLTAAGRFFLLRVDTCVPE